MDMIFQRFLMLSILLYISFFIFVQYDILCIESLLGIMVSFIKYLERFGKRLRIIKNQRFSIYIWNRKSLLKVFTMLFLFNFLFFLKLLLLISIIEMSIYWVVIMSCPIFIVNLLDLLIYLFLHLLLMIFFVNVVYDIEIFLVIIVKSFLPFYWKSNIPILEVIFRKLLIIYNIISISDWP